MATPKVLYAVRIPVDLKRLMDQAAKSAGVTSSQLVIQACWRYLGPETQIDALVARAEVVPIVPSLKPNMDALRAICAGNVQAQEKIAGDSGVPVCPHKEWADDGEQYACRLKAGHKGKCALGQRVP